MVTFSDLQLEINDRFIHLELVRIIKTCGFSLYVRNYRIIKATNGIKSEAAGLTIH